MGTRATTIFSGIISHNSVPLPDDVILIIMGGGLLVGERIVRRGGSKGFPGKPHSEVDNSYVATEQECPRPVHRRVMHHSAWSIVLVVPERSCATALSIKAVAVLYTQATAPLRRGNLRTHVGSNQRSPAEGSSSEPALPLRRASLP